MTEQKTTKEAKSTEKPRQLKAARVERVRSPKVNAGECPKSPRHQNTIVYRTAGRTRYCKCNDCGATWKKTGDYADALKEYCATLADSLKEAPRVQAPDGADVVVIEDKLAKGIEQELRKLIA